MFHSFTSSVADHRCMINIIMNQTAATCKNRFVFLFLTLSLPQPVHCQAVNSTHAPENSTYSGSIKNIIPVLCVLMNILSHVNAKMINDFKFRTLIFRFQVILWQ